ncbi:hypothetical protein HDV05_000291, partial [Chytridiales sp. JEL 0842]
MDSLSSSTAVGAAIAAVAIAALLAYDRHYIHKNHTVPGPPRLPFIGNFLSWIAFVTAGKDHEMREAMHAKYGSIVSLSGFGKEGVDIADADFISQQFTSLKRADLITQLSKGIFRYALFILPSDDVWKRHRKFIQPGFGPSHLRQGVDASNHVMNTLCSLWDPKLDQEQDHSIKNIRVDLFHLASSISLDVIGLVAFSYSYDSVLYYEMPERQTAIKSYNRAFELIMGRLGIPEVLWSLLGLGVEQAQREMAPLKEAIMDAIQAKRQQKVSEEARHREEDMVSPKSLLGMKKMDVLDRLLEVDGWSDEEIVDEVIALFLAGGETTANSIVFNIWELVQNPECLAKARVEIDSVLGPAPSSTGNYAEVSWDDTHKFDYLDHVIKETLRLHPVLTTFPGREVHSGFHFQGHHIQQGSLVSANMRSVHLDPTHWPQPLVFDPDRWIDFTPAPGTYTPFGIGPHMCIGSKLATLEQKVCLARMIHRYDFELVKDQKLELMTTVTHGFKKGILFD